MGQLASLAGWIKLRFAPNCNERQRFNEIFLGRELREGKTNTVLQMK